MPRTLLRALASVLCIVASVAIQARGQSESGTVVAISGTLRVQRAGVEQTASIGAPLFSGDRLTTGATDLAKLVFQDDSVLDVAANTTVRLDRQIFDPKVHRVQSLVRLDRGKVRAWVSEHYREPKARYEVETPTAIASVHGTEFVVLYNEQAERTEIVGIVDTVEVAGKLALIGGLVQVGPQFYTEILKGRVPSAAERLEDARFSRYVEGLDIVGTGRRDGLSVMHPAVAGRLLAPQDLPAPAEKGAGTAAEGLDVGAPGGSLAERVSPDVRANTQPLQGFRASPPGQAPAGNVTVPFGPH
jgi:hypothetical protein